MINHITFFFSLQPCSFSHSQLNKFTPTLSSSSAVQLGKTQVDLQLYFIKTSGWPGQIGDNFGHLSSSSGAVEWAKQLLLFFPEQKTKAAVVILYVIKELLSIICYWLLVRNFLLVWWLQKEKLHTHLAVLYLERVLSLLSDSPTNEDQLTRARDRLQALLRESNLYRAQFLLGEIDATTLHYILKIDPSSCW